LNEQEQADLVAYLDGELKGAAVQRLEARLALDPAVRAEADALKRTWELLDLLPKAATSPDFTNRTLERLAPVRTQPQTVVHRRYWAPWALAWAASLLAAAGVGFAGARLLIPQQPGDQELVRDLRVIENKRLYELVEDLEFLRQLDSPELFGEDNAGSGRGREE
jgi:anti-sigma factor RsiW